MTFKHRVLVYVLLTIAFTFPVSLEPHLRTFASGPDTRLYLWTLGWDLHALSHQPLAIFDANIFFPEKQTLAYSEHLIGAAILAAPIAPFTNNLLLILNWVLLASTLLTAVGTDFLAGELGTKPDSRLLAGIIGTFSSPRLTRLTQTHLATLHWIPFALAFGLRYVRTRNPGDLRWALFFFTAQAITSGHGGLMCALGLGLLFVWAIVTRNVTLGSLVRHASLPGALLLLANVPFVLPYYAVRSSVGLTRTLDDARGWEPTLQSFLSSDTRFSSALRAVAPAFDSWVGQANATLFPGFVALGLMTLGALRWNVSPTTQEMHFARSFLWLLAITSVWLTLGPRALLYSAAYQFIPGFDLVRVPSRFFLLALTAIAVLAALSFDRLKSLRLRLAIIAVAVAELFPAAWEAPRDPIVTPPVDAWLATQPKPFRVVELPIPQPELSLRQARFHSEFMVHGTAHWQPMMNGYSSLVPPKLEKLYAELHDFPSESGLHSLEELGVGYVVFHEDMYQPGRFADAMKRVGASSDRLRLVHRDGEGRVYALARTLAVANR